MRFDPVATFLQEADDLLSQIEESALLLDSGDPPGETVNRLFRAFHTLKGSGAMVGMDLVAGFTHHVETLLDGVRSGRLPVSTKLTRLILESRDHIRNLLASIQEAAPLPDSNGLIASLAAYAGQTGTPPALTVPAAGGETSRLETTWTIGFRPNPGILSCGASPILLFRDLRSLGACRITAHTEDVPPLEEIQPDACYLWWTIELRTACDQNTIRDVFLFVEDGSELTLESAVEPENQPKAEDRTAASAEKPVIGPVRPALCSAPDELHKTLVRESTVRVPSGRLDRLVNLVGELVMNQSRLVQAAAHTGAAELANPVQELGRLVDELRDNVLEIRMLPIGTLFGRFRRLVHDLSTELGKEVDLIAEGAETELDKSILDQLGEPMVHLLRNAIDHGIEPGAERAASGKPRRGTVRLSAVHAGSDVVVSIEDDGRGIDRAAILAKAIEKQLVPPDANPSEKDLLNLILLPGFSTAREVTNVSGRGVGMDVVKRQIDALRGSLSIASEAGKGTRLAVTLPLTLAIIDGLLVEVGGDQFILPMAAVTENVELHAAMRARNNGRNVLAVRGEPVPYIDVREAFGVGGGPPAVARVVIVRFEDQRVGLVVDRVIGTHQTVIQSLGRFFRRIEVVSGATIMGDGRVALILDVCAVVRFANERSQKGLRTVLPVAC